MEIDSSSESEIDMETVKRSVDCKDKGRESEIDLRAQDTRAPIDSSSESDLDITMKDGESAGVADVEPHSEVVTDKQRETKTTQKRTSSDKLRQKKLKQKVFLKIMSIYLQEGQLRISETSLIVSFLLNLKHINLFFLEDKSTSYTLDTLSMYSGHGCAIANQQWKVKR